MTHPSFFTDEDMFGDLAPQLRLAGLRATSTPEANRLGESDQAQLEWAAQNGFAIVTFNVKDFARLHVTWMKAGLHHAGVVLSRQRPIGDVLRRLTHLASRLDARTMVDRLEYLSNW